MDTLHIKEITHMRLGFHCTHELLDRVLNDFGKECVAIDSTDACDDVWEIGDFIYTNSRDRLHERLKAIYAFTYLGGTLTFDGHTIAYGTLSRLLGNDEPDKAKRCMKGIPNVYDGD